MKLLERIILVQFFLFDAEEIAVSGNTAWLGPNGAGKTSVLDSIQIALLGAHQGYLKFNTQSTSTAHKKNYRTIRDYCLGVIQNSDVPNSAAGRRRDVADSYITLVFRDQASGEPVSVGVALHAQHDVADHVVKGLYVLPGIELSLDDHIETINDDTIPLLWKDFEHSLYRKCVAAGRTPEITDKTETYIKEMLFALQPRAKRINPREFMKAFRKSVTLRDIESVNEFVRDFVVEAHPIDKHKAIAQIEEFRKLDNLVKQTQAQIRDLTGLGKRYDRLYIEHREMATLDYLHAFYEHEDLSIQAGALEDAIGEDTMAAEKAGKEAELLDKAVDDMREAIQKLEYTLNSDPEARQISDLQASLDEAGQSRSPHLRTLVNHRLDLAVAIQRMNAVPDFTHTRPDAEGMAIRLDALAKHPEPDAGKSKKVLTEALELITGYTPWISRELPEAKLGLEELENALKKLLATAKALDRHGVRLGENTSMAIALLAENGIQATPVCSLLRITQPAWQPAIEAYLGRNRESLVITGGRERDAVRVLRSLPEKRRLYDVTIVQPEHLRQSDRSDPENVWVSSLVDGDNPVAVSYLRMLLGKTRMVDTEEELEAHPRSLTVDGMLSANGGTKSIRLVQPDAFLIGTKVADNEKSVLRRQIAAATDEYNHAKAYHAALDLAKQSIENLGDPARMAETVANACEELARLNRRIDGLNNLVGDLQESDRISALRQSIVDKNEELKLLESSYRAALGSASAFAATAKQKEKNLELMQPKVTLARDRADKAAAHQDHDQSIVERIMGEHDARTNFPYAKRMDDCLDRRQKVQKRIEPLLQSLSVDFDRYLATAGITLIEERDNWRKARVWVKAEHERLEGTQLARYQEEVENAKRMAEKAFREDVAVRISEAIQRTRNSLSELNKILDSCPPFSNGEKYAFEATPAKAYESLYNYIEKASKGTDLFSGEGSAHEELIAYLQQSADSEAGKEPNPLDDYRLLFNFDLQIKRDGKVISHLSKRVGPGSNGEHRTPFYVIAGAALASAYRIRTGETNAGAALMLLDEAFHGMDSQNSLAAARFLKELGLQLLIAAPDSEFGKFTPICDTAYELMRFELDVYMEPSYIKEKAHQLMTSDMPAEHPELVFEKAAELEANP